MHFVRLNLVDACRDLSRDCRRMGDLSRDCRRMVRCTLMLFVIATRLSSNGQVHLDAGRDSVEIDVESLEIVVRWLEIVVRSSCSSASSFQNVFCKIYTSPQGVRLKSGFEALSLHTSILWKIFTVRVHELVTQIEAGSRRVRVCARCTKVQALSSDKAKQVSFLTSRGSILSVA